MYSIDYFIAKFEAIPEDKWCHGMLHDDKGRSCALGHCGVKNLPSKINPNVFEWGRTQEADELARLIGQVESNIDIDINDYFKVSDVNDSTVLKSHLSNPRQRMLNYLYSVKIKDALKGLGYYGIN